MKKRFLQSFVLQVIYKGGLYYFLKLFVGVEFSKSKFLENEEQFIVVANHNSHLDTLSLLCSLPRKILWRVKPVAAEDYFGRNKFQASISNYFLNTLLIKRKIDKDPENNPIQKMMNALDAGYSLILFPEGTRGKPEQMEKIKSGIAHLLSKRPHIKYVPVFMTGMGRSLPKGKIIVLPYNSAIHYGKPTLVGATDKSKILEQISKDFEDMNSKYQTVNSED